MGWKWPLSLPFLGLSKYIDGGINMFVVTSQMDGHLGFSFK
jgi:hypothetical protein